MKQEQFDHLLEDRFEKIRTVLSNKSADYVRGGDKLHNFKVAAASEAHLWTDIWSALTDVVWYKIFEENDQFYISSHMYTYRAAGDFCAMLNQHGNYLDHYCSSRPGVVTPAIEEAMKKKGWLYHKC